MRPTTTPRAGRPRSLTLIVIGIVVPLAVAGALSATVWPGEAPAWDLEVMRYVHDRSGLILDAPMTALSALGGGVGLMVIVVGSVVALARAGRGADALFLGVAVAGAEVITRVAKPIVARPRPELWEHGYPASGYAFPSGHTTSSMALAAAVTVLAWNTRWRWWALAGGALFTFGVGVSRVYLGVHYPSDVIAGWCLGVAWVSVLILLRAAERRAGRRAGNVPP